jgi:CRP/FNR family cyclic AMP-dependent transcriptional regulator
MAHAAGWAPLLKLDTELADRLPAATMEAAAPFAVAPTEWLEAGEWEPPQPAEHERAGHLGLLVIDGFIARRVLVLERPVTELLGPGDLVIPWEPDRTEPFDAGATWEVLDPARIAVLDRRFTGLLGRWPELTAALMGRAVSRSRAATLTLAISQVVGIELRLLVLLWHVAERWGAPDGDGATVLPVRLTHELLASLISAQRPTVTRALGQLAQEHHVSRRGDGLLVVHGEPPSDFRRIRPKMN